MSIIAIQVVSQIFKYDSTRIPFPRYDTHVYFKIYEFHPTESHFRIKFMIPRESRAKSTCMRMGCIIKIRIFSFGRSHAPRYMKRKIDIMGRSPVAMTSN